MDDATLRAGHRVPGERFSDSRPLGWKGVLCRGYCERPHVEHFETLATPDIGLVAVTRGVYTIESRRSGRWVSAAFAPGSVGVNLPAETSVLRWRSAVNERLESVQVHLEADLVEATIEEAGAGASLTRSHSVDLGDPFVAAACENLGRAATLELPGLYAETVAQALAVHLVLGRSRADPPARVRGLSARSLTATTGYMRAHLNRSISLDQLAEQAFMSKWHFLRQFKAATGQTPHAFLTAMRISRAKALLERGHEVSHVATACGYSSPSTFKRSFQRATGSTPRQYRATGSELSGDGREIRSSAADVDPATSAPTAAT